MQLRIESKNIKRNVDEYPLKFDVKYKLKQYEPRSLVDTTTVITYTIDLGSLNNENSPLSPVNRVLFKLFVYRKYLFHIKVWNK